MWMVKQGQLRCPIGQPARMRISSTAWLSDLKLQRDFAGSVNDITTQLVSGTPIQVDSASNTVHVDSVFTWMKRSGLGCAQLRLQLR